MKGRPYALIAWLKSADPEKTYEIKEVRTSRSLTQNGYYWAMLHQLAAALQMPSYEVHANMIREWGPCEILSIDETVPLDQYFDYYEVIGRDAEMQRQIVKVFKGSSRMDSAEFSRLITGMREECIAQGIDVMTPEEIESLRFVEPEHPGKPTQ